MTGLFRIRVNIEDRRVVERDADRLQLRGQRRRKPRRHRRVPAATQHRHRRPFGKRLPQASHPSTLLVDADPEWHLGCQRLHVTGKLGDLLRRLDVAREQDDASELKLTRERPQLDGDSRPRHAANQQLADVAANAQRHSTIIWATRRPYSGSAFGAVSIMPCAYQGLRPHSHRPRWRHSGHLAHLLVSSRRADYQRRDQPQSWRDDRDPIRRPCRHSLQRHGRDSRSGCLG